MCGIFAAFGLTGDARANWKLVVKLAKRLRHRGPDGSNMTSVPDGDRTDYLVHKRMALVEPGMGGDQPLYSSSGNTVYVANGEIYNHAKLREEHGVKCNNHNSDCAIIGDLYEKFGVDFVNKLDGMFAFALKDKATGAVVAARDHMGKIPLYIGYGYDGSVWFSSEMKGFAGEERIERYEIFPPGHVYTRSESDPGTIRRWYNPRWATDEEYVPDTPLDLAHLRETVVDAVVNRLMTDVPFGVLLSGGLDSSLITSITVRHMKEAKNRYRPPGAMEETEAEVEGKMAEVEALLAKGGLDGGVEAALKDTLQLQKSVLKHLKEGERVMSFSIGIKGAPDLQNGRAVAEFLGTDHHELYFTPQEALDALPDVVYHLESWEQVRASVPMYLMSRKIKALGVKMVLSGEGADELFGGYLYFHEAPSPAEFHKECVRKTTRLHQWDVLRANKSTMAWGLEARTPLLSQQVCDVAMNMDPQHKMIDMSKRDADGKPFMEKYALRKAFDCPDDPYLPASVLWRQKEQFSDGVGYDWVDSLRDYAEAEVSDEQFARRAERFPHEPPATKEYYLLRSLFEEHFVTGKGNGASATATVPTGKSIACSTPEALAWNPEWEKSAGDISGRAVGVHDASAGFVLEEDAGAAGPVAVGAVAPGARGTARLAGAPAAPAVRAPRAARRARHTRRAPLGPRARSLLA